MSNHATGAVNAIERSAMNAHQTPALRPPTNAARVDLTLAREIRPGTDDRIVRWSACPDCDGWGWLCSNPFAQFNRRFVQCPTCEAAYAALPRSALSDRTGQDEQSPSVGLQGGEGAGGADGVPLPAAQSDPQQSPMTSKEGGEG